jgi:hypothetical protein
MPMTLVKGHYRIVGASPAGGSVRFGATAVRRRGDVNDAGHGTGAPRRPVRHSVAQDGSGLRSRPRGRLLRLIVQAPQYDENGPTFEPATARCRVLTGFEWPDNTSAHRPGGAADEQVPPDSEQSAASACGPAQKCEPRA